MFNQILVVCHGNICRSPAAEALFKHAFHEQSLSIAVQSAGVHATPGLAFDPKMQKFLSDEKIWIQDHQSKRTDEKLLRWADLILVMEQNHQRELALAFPFACGKIHLLSKWEMGSDIMDPYCRNHEDYAKAFHQIAVGVRSWCAQLKK